MNESLGSVRVYDRAEFAVAAIEGEVDLSNANDVQGALEGSVANTHRGLVIDLTATRYLDSSAITVLFRLVRATRARNQDLRIVVPAASPIRRVVDLTELVDLVGVYDTLDEALVARPTDAEAS